MKEIVVIPDTIQLDSVSKLKMWHNRIRDGELSSKERP